MRRFLAGFLAGIVVLPLGILVAAKLGLFPIRSNTNPPRWESAFAHMALDASAARQAPGVENPVAPTEENLLAGVKLFKNDCAGCHGTPASAKENEADVILYPAAPQFVLHPPSKPDYQLFWIARGGVRYSGMFAWGGQFAPDANGQDTSDQKIWTAITFIKHMDSLPPAVDAEWRKK
jgi:mono/diheme cytochrome c family protein